MTRARDLADLISSGKVEASEIATGTITSANIQTATLDTLGKTEFYGFRYVDTNGDGVKEDLQITTTNNGADNISVANITTDFFDESFFAQRYLSFTVNASGDLIVTV